MATIASGLNGGAGYNSSDTITSTTLNNHVNGASVTAIANADIASNAAIAFTKLAPITSQKVVGSIGSGNAEIDIVGTNGILLDEDDLVTDSNTKGATQQSIKAYVDGGGGFTPSSYAGEESVTLPNGLIMKMGISSSVSTNASLTVNFGAAFNAAPITVQLTKLSPLKVDGLGELTVDNVTASEFTIRNGLDIAGQVYWFAIGR